ncbi:MAG: 16S rRNA (guanine(966)-N(2))-methyltransferase RsmD [Burkholderiales bacterium]|nr:16S rRNA (guanine(966)-N(2))-methyltransferase RsmD [Burkholderiales bacterium]MBH2017470.1 16S rRNA (guanine(966)-N(2))-methyltransferase RsmD [Burkholderiales bacterium]
MSRRRLPSPTQPDVLARQIQAASKVARTAAQEVRIIGGQWKRTPLPVPLAAGLRPTPARVRETLFNWLGQDLTGWRVLDAFAGSGALGLEAASRGATSVCLLERDPALARSLQALVQRLLSPGGAARTSVSVTQADALPWMAQHAARQDAPFDLVFLDPPFDEGLFESALEAATGCVPAGGWIYVEAPRELGIDALAGLRRQRHGRAGAVHFHLFQRVGEAPAAA